MNTQSTTHPTFGGYETGGAVRESSAAKRAAAAIKRAVQRVLKSMMAYHIERETARELSGLPSYILKDIGIRREDIHEIAAHMARERADAWARHARASNGFGD